MTAAIDQLLEDAQIPATGSRDFDVAAALHRLAADTAGLAAPPGIERAAQAGQRLSVVCRWALNEPDAAEHMGRLAEEPGRADTADDIDVQGALVFACLLHWPGARNPQQFWWQLAAGAGSRAAAYCLHLHHLHLNEPREARHWYHQLISPVIGVTPAPPDAAFLEGLEVFARYFRASGSGALPPTGRLESEVHRLAAGARESSVIVPRTDRRLVDQRPPGRRVLAIRSRCRSISSNRSADPKAAPYRPRPTDPGGRERAAVPWRSAM